MRPADKAEMVPAVRLRFIMPSKYSPENLLLLEDTPRKKAKQWAGKVIKEPFKMARAGWRRIAAMRGAAGKTAITAGIEGQPLTYVRGSVSGINFCCLNEKAPTLSIDNGVHGEYNSAMGLRK